MGRDDEDDARAGIDEFIFCEGCGARLQASDRTCPKCGRPAPGILSTSSASSDLAAGRTASFPRLTGADFSAAQRKEPSAPQIIASTLDPHETTVIDAGLIEAAAEGAAGRAQEEGKGKRASSKRRAGRGEDGDSFPTEDDFNRPRRGRWVLPVLAVCLVAACAWFVVADPLGVMPGLYERFAAAAAEAFPSRYADVESSSDEDDEEETETAEAGVEIVEATLSDAEAYARLTALYEQIVAFQDDIVPVVKDYNGSYIASDYSKRVAASESAYALREEVQAVLDELEALNLSDDSVYLEDVEHLIQLATWMYNRVNVLCESWDISLALDEDESAADHRSEIVAPLLSALDAQGNNVDVIQYETYLYEWAPEEKTSS